MSWILPDWLARCRGCHVPAKRFLAALDYAHAERKQYKIHVAELLKIIANLSDAHSDFAKQCRINQQLSQEIVALRSKLEEK